MCLQRQLHVATKPIPIELDLSPWCATPRTATLPLGYTPWTVSQMAPARDRQGFHKGISQRPSEPVTCFPYGILSGHHRLPVYLQTDRLGPDQPKHAFAPTCGLHRWTKPCGSAGLCGHTPFASVTTSHPFKCAMPHFQRHHIRNHSTIELAPDCFNMESSRGCP